MSRSRQPGRPPLSAIKERRQSISITLNSTVLNLLDSRVTNLKESVASGGEVNRSRLIEEYVLKGLKEAPK